MNFCPICGRPDESQPTELNGPYCTCIPQPSIAMNQMKRPRLSGATLREDIAAMINANGAETGSDTPDFILARYLIACLAAFDAATNRRDEWYGHRPRVAAVLSGQAAPLAPARPEE